MVWGSSSLTHCDSLSLHSTSNSIPSLSCSPSSHEDSHKLLLVEPECRRPADVLDELRVQFHFPAQQRLAIWRPLLHRQQLYCQLVSGVVRLHSGRHLPGSVHSHCEAPAAPIPEQGKTRHGLHLATRGPARLSLSALLEDQSEPVGASSSAIEIDTYRLFHLLQSVTRTGAPEPSATCCGRMEDTRPPSLTTCE